MTDLPQEALTLISRARVLEDMIRNAMTDPPQRATLGELLRHNDDLFGADTEALFWAARIRNGCAHISRQEHSVIEILQATDFLNDAIAKMNGEPGSAVNDAVESFETPATPFVFSHQFYVLVIWLVAIVSVTIGVMTHLWSMRSS